MAVGRPSWPSGVVPARGAGRGRGRGQRERGGESSEQYQPQQRRRKAPALEALDRFRNSRQQQQQRRQQRRAASSNRANAMIVNSKGVDNSNSMMPDARMTMDGDASCSKASNSYVSTPRTCFRQHTLNESGQSPFQIGSDAMFSPRADAWLFLFISSCASAASLSISLPPEAWRTSTERAALAVMGISTVVAATMGIAFRYGPSRDFLTRGITNRADGRLRLHANLTPELILGVFVLLLNLVFAALVFQPSNDMAVSSASEEIWNTNLFFATWTSASLSSYLVADLLTVHDASGVLPKEYSLVMGNAVSRGWTLLFLSTIALLAFSISFRSGVTCSGVYMSTTHVCQTTTLMGVIFGILGMLMAGTYLVISLFEQRSNNYNDGNINNPAKSKRNIASTVLGAISLICYSINAAFVTNPSMFQDMTEPTLNTPANVYFTSWICFALSLYLCIRNVEVFLVPGSQKTVSPLAVLYSGQSKSKRRLHRGSSRSSRMSDSTVPESQYSDNEGTNDDLDVEDQQALDFNADEVLTAMADSQSEDGPMLFLPVNGGMSADNPSDLDDSSYPSVTHLVPHLRNGQLAPPPPPQRGLQTFKSIPKLGREPHKPRPQSPGGHRASMVAPPPAPPKSTTKTVRSNATRSQAEPPDSGNENKRRQDPISSSESIHVNGISRTKQQMDPLESSSDNDFFIQDIDTKLQAKISSSSGSEEGISLGPSKSSRRSRNSKKSSSIKSRTRANHQNNLVRGVSNNTSRRSSETRSFNIDEETQPPLQFASSDDNNNDSFYGVETVHSESLSGISLGNDNPLDRTKRAAFSTQQMPAREPSIWMKPVPHQSPEFQRPQAQERRETLMSAMMRPNIATDYSVSDATSVAKTDNGSNFEDSAAEGGKSKSTKSSSSSKSKSRSSSRKKRRSKSRDRSKKSKSSSKNTSKSPSRTSGRSKSKTRSRPSSMRSSGVTNNSSSYHGPPTISQDSNGPAGPPTMSASEGSSIPRTNDGEEEPMVHRMGHVGPRGQVPAYGGSPSPTDGDDTRPVKLINGSPDNMSMVSEPTMDGFDPEFREGGTMRYSNTEGALNVGSETSSQTNENKGVLRQGAVDKMVMEALRQAQEARQTSHHTDMGPPRRAPTQLSNPQGHSMSDPNKMGMAPPAPYTPGSHHQHTASQYSQAAESRTSRSTKSKSKSPHNSKQQKKELSFRIDKKNQKHRASAGTGSGSGARSGAGQRSLHSFYSQSMDGTTATPSFDDGDAFAC